MKRCYFLFALLTVSCLAMAQPYHTTHWSMIESKPDVDGWLKSGKLFNWSSKREMLIEMEPVHVEWGFIMTEDSVWYLYGDVIQDSLYFGNSLEMKIIEIIGSLAKVEGLYEYRGIITRSMDHQINDAGKTVRINEAFPNLAVEDTVFCLIYLNDKIFELSKSAGNSKIHYYVFYDPEIQSSFEHLYKIKEE